MGALKITVFWTVTVVFLADITSARTPLPPVESTLQSVKSTTQTPPLLVRTDQQPGTPTTSSENERKDPTVSELGEELQTAAYTAEQSTHFKVTSPDTEILMTSSAARRSGSLQPASRRLSDEERLMQTLFSTYNALARPVMNSSKTVNVEIMFSLMHVKDLDVRSQILTTTGLLILDWTDERLTWNPAEYNGMQEIIIEAKGLWRPEFAVINGAEKIYEEYDQFRAVISKSGGVHWEPGGVFKTMCEIDITYYPFDEQTCTLTFGAWSYHTAKMNLTNARPLVNLDSYSENGEWEIPGTEVERNEFAYENNPKERFGFINFKLHMRRRHTFYVLNVILPSIMTSVLLLSVFFCTPGQKVQIGVVVLLSFRIFLLNVSGNIPKTSDHIPLLGIYLTCTMAITTLSMVLTVFVLNLHHISDRPVPTCVKKFVFIYLARVLGMCGTTDEVITANAKLPQKKFRRSNIADANVDERTAIFELHNRPAQNNDSHSVRGSPDLGYVHRVLEAEADKQEDYSKDWKKMAEIFDRLFFWLFLMAILVSTLVLFHPLTGLSKQSKGFPKPG